MEAILNYTLKVGMSMLALYLFYYALLRLSNNFKFNRLYLLLAPLVALLLPLLTRPAILARQPFLSENLLAIQLSQVTVGAGQPTIPWALTLPMALTGLYFAGVAFVLLKLLSQLKQLHQTKKKATLASKIKQAEVYLLPDSYPTFAFGKYVFLSTEQSKLNAAEQQQVLAHELAHVKYGHTKDVLLYELYTAILWFHPAVWLLKQELRNVHEYQADAEVVQEHQVQTYTSLLSREALFNMGLPVGSYFTKPQVLLRLRMLQKKRQQAGWLRPVLALPLLACLAFVMARQQANADPVSETPEKYEKPYTYVENMPRFDGGESEMLKFLGQNTRYPEQAKIQGIEGLVVVSFVVRKNGSLDEISIVKPLEESLDAEALRVVTLMEGKWQPGSQDGRNVPVRYTLPIRFSIR